MPAATELLLGLWLRGLKQSKCSRLVAEWRRALVSRGEAANDNISSEERSDRIAALQSLDKLCGECLRDCPLRPAMKREAVI